jgi:hypothetical protein
VCIGTYSPNIPMVRITELVVLLYLRMRTLSENSNI